MSAAVMNWINKQKERRTTTTSQGNNNTTSIGVTMTAYVNKVGQDGYVTILIDGRGEKKHGLYMYTKLTLLGINNNGDRVRLRVEDGEWKGLMGSMMIKGGADTYLDLTPPDNKIPTIKLKYGKFVSGWYSIPRDQKLDQQFATLTVGNISVQVTLNSDWTPGSGRTPLPVGTYEIATPDGGHPPEQTNFYTVGGVPVKNYKIWFPILPKSSERFIHIGHLSHGCISIIDYDKYPQIHDYLIKHRGKGKNGDTIVALLQVIK
ncbi:MULTISPECIES: hypothetical protein [Gilliamella]|uniref:Uncharacterized protein n=1 Tax=Gilliamella apicola TaxID=1196095 RepID=A0A556SUN3_9GAMM|nr:MULTISPECIES: hypothetical protein [Gilliamella]MBI0096550.1 hypothetical protein [Gilliamella sp. W8136]TSK04838.1 hypothetical protein FPQ15_03235 [Gilliamella apicola]